MVLTLFAMTEEKYLGEEDPIGISVEFDDGIRFDEKNVFDDSGATFDFVFKDGELRGVHLSKDSLKLLHASLGAFLGR